jgi:hypothetical protein
MNKKMSFFRFCRRSLTALPVFFVLAACNHWGGLSPEALKKIDKARRLPPLRVEAFLLLA